MESSGANSVRPISFIFLTWQQVWQRRVNNRHHIPDISSYFDYFAHFPKQTREIQMEGCILTVLLCTEDTKMQPAIDMMIPPVQWTSGSISSIKVAKSGSPGKERRRSKKQSSAFSEHSPGFKQLLAQGLSEHRLISLRSFLINCLVAFLNQHIFLASKTFCGKK